MPRPPSRSFSGAAPAYALGAVSLYEGFFTDDGEARQGWEKQMPKLSIIGPYIIAGAAALALAACGEKQKSAETPVAATQEAPAREQSAPPSYSEYAAAALANPQRREGDSADDERRKAGEALDFIGAAPGVTVFEVEAGGGWFTELLSYAVGPDGTVIMQNPAGFRKFAGEEIDARLAGGRLANVRESYSNFDALDAESGSVDLATWVLGPHELYYKPESGTLGDPAGSYAEIFRILRPGGSFIVIDHSAAAGAPETTGDTLHRIDKAIVVGLAEAAGFVVETESDFLANPDDPLTNPVFDPAIRGQTSQFAIRFRKPETE
jgi:predicted methyltransferase